MALENALTGTPSDAYAVFEPSAATYLRISEYQQGRLVSFEKFQPFDIL